MKTMFCPNCRSMTFPGQERCRTCGRSLDQAFESNQSCLAGFDDVRPAPKTVEASNPEAPYLPYEPRPSQLEIIADIRNALDSKRHIVIESGTGTGKTIVSLAAGLEHAKRFGKKVVYITRTISQSDQVMKELKAISEIQKVSGITLTGRNKSCPLFNGKEEYANLSSNILSMMCDEKKTKSMRKSAGGCRYYDRTKARIEDIGDYCRKNFPKSEELDRYCEEQGVCPYETKKALMKDFDVIVAPYIHILNPDIRESFLNNLGGPDVPILLIIDEAHNLIDAAREQESFSIDMKMVQGAIDECTLLNSPEVGPNVTIGEFIKYLKMLIKNLANEHIPIGKFQKVLEGDPIGEGLMKRFNLSQMELTTAINRVVELGEKRMDALAENDNPQVSSIFALGSELYKWSLSGNSRYIRSIKVGSEGEFLYAACIDPSDIVSFMNSLDGALHMSGTLQPLDQYAKIMGLPNNTIPRTYPSPFPKANRPVLYVDNVTTRYSDMKNDPSISARMSKYIVKLCNSVDMNAMVFFPSYRVMNDFRQDMEYGIDKPLYWEESGRQKNTMRSLDIFRKGTGGVFSCVMGGSIAEGMDFPGDELSMAIIVGMPYPPPSLESDAMRELFDKRYGPGKGWIYTNDVPAIRKIRQAAGRLIRTESDRGITIILDSRAKKYVRQLEAELSDDPVKAALEFFSNKA